MKKTTRSDKSNFKATLLNAEQNIHLPDWRISSKELRCKTKTPFSVSKTTLRGGRQEGVELIVVDNGRLRVTLIPTRGMGVLKVESDDLCLGWASPVKEVVHPQFVNLNARGGLGMLDGFNEWLVRCGLENFGAPGRDQFITNTGAKAEMDLTLHGKIANIPASEVEVIIDRRPPFAIRVRGRVDERMFFGPKLELWTELATEAGSSAFTIKDVVTNRSAGEQEFQLLYHINFGPPLLEEGSQFIGAVNRVTPMNETAAQGLKTWETCHGPTPGFVEQVYTMEPRPDKEGFCAVMLQNADADRACAMRFSTAQLPYLTLWKNCAALEDGYVTGIEPATGFPNTRAIERKAGRVPKLAPGQSREFAIQYEILAGKKAVSAKRQACAQG